jgi:hypothetical protein
MIFAEEQAAHQALTTPFWKWLSFLGLPTERDYVLPNVPPAGQANISRYLSATSMVSCFRL